MAEHHFFLALHSILEVFPISSSWHLLLAGVNAQAIHHFHIWLLPAVFLYAATQYRQSQILQQPLWAIGLSIIPTGCLELLIKLKIIPKFILNIAVLHTVMGLLLCVMAMNQISSMSGSKSISTRWALILSGLCQSIALMTPGISRLGCSLLYCLFYRISFKKALSISFSLEMVALSVAGLSDFMRGSLIFPSLLEVIIASMAFWAAIFLATKLDWWFIAICGVYRLILGLTLLTF
jgi:undecaprenyl pyrophosphate phosphatase UppP